MNVQQALTSLQEFIKLMVEAGVTDTSKYSPWAKANEATIAKLFSYERQESMPHIYELVRPFFHPDLPLIGLNYTSAANANLFGDWISGWTDALRLCRGIVFDTSGNLIAFPFPKFFNFQEHEETKTTNLPDGPFVITSKYDGHLGIIFEYNGQLILTTRGSFTSPSAELGNQIITHHYKRFGWKLRFPSQLTLLAEIIAPETQVHLNYGNKRYLMVVGAFNRDTLAEFSYSQLQELGHALHITVARRLTIDSINELLSMIADPRFTDREGYVVRFSSNGLRVKSKFRTYLQKMFMSALTGKGYAALMQWWLNGELANKLALLPEEVVTKINKMWSEITTVMAGPGEPQAKWQRLYLFYNDNADTLSPTDHPSVIQQSTFQAICREFCKEYCQQID